MSESGVITPIANGETILTIKSKKGYNVRKITINVSGLTESNDSSNSDVNNSNDNNTGDNSSSNQEKSDETKPTINLKIPDVYLTVGSSGKIIASQSGITFSNYSNDIIDINNYVIVAKKIGETSVTATYDDVETTFKVIVTDKSIAIKSISLDKSNITMNVSDEELLQVTINPINATNASLSFTSSNNKVVTVDSNGKIKAIASGTAIITVKSNNSKTATCKITINNKTETPKSSENTTIEVTKVTLDKSILSIYVSETKELQASVTPSNATNKDITWISSDPNVASVVNGKVTGVSVGTTKILARSNNGISAQCTIIVSNKPNETPPMSSDVRVTGISLSETNKIVYLNASSKIVNLSASITPSNATNKNITWTTSDSNVATVSNGVVTAKNIGNAIITVKTADGGYEAKFNLSVKKKIIIVIGASQVTRMSSYKTSYSNGNNSYSVSAKTLNYINLSGSGFAYQTGDGWNSAKKIIESYSSSKSNAEFYVFFPLSGNDIKKFTCNSISTSNATINTYVKNYNNVISNIKNNGYNVLAYVVSMHPLRVSQSSNSYVVTNENSNSCKADYRSNWKYYQFNKAIGSIINNAYTTNLTYEYLFDKIMKTNDNGKNFSYLVTYNTTDGIHWDKATASYYVDLMLNTIGLL